MRTPLNISNHSKRSWLNTREKRGFALIATISILVLLALISVGLLSLSTITIRTTGQNSAQMEARANARMALMIALGELQKNLGPDQRISAPSGLLDSDTNTSTLDGLTQKHITGVWESRNDNLSTDNPDYDRQAPFLKWLVSHDQENDLKSLDFVKNGTFSKPVTLLTTSNGSDVEAGKVKSENGSYAWWVGDENCKARINPRNDMDRKGGLTTAEVVASTATPSPHGVSALKDFENFETNSENSDKLISMETLALMNSPQLIPSDHIHDLTPYSESLLTNVRTGGLREDLSLYFERDDVDWTTPWGKAEGALGLPDGPLGPNGEIALSPPDEYDVLSWKTLYHWYNMSRQIIPRGFYLSAMNGATSRINDISNPGWNSGVTSVRPVITRLQMLISYGAKKITRRGKTSYDFLLYRYPVITIWNPYNVTMRVPQYHLFLHTLPLEHEIFRDKNGGKGTGLFNYNWEWGSAGGNAVFQLSSALNLKPGEAKTLSYAGPGSGGFNSHLVSPGSPSFNRDNNPGKEFIIGNSDISPTPPMTESTKIIISSEDASWETSGDSYDKFETTFGFRGEAKKEHKGHPTRMKNQMFAAQVAWRRENANPAVATISENNRPQETLGAILDAPKPFLHLDIRLKTMDEANLPNKVWSQCIPSLPFAAATSTAKHSSKGVDASTTFYAHPYAVDFESVNNNGEGVFQSTARFGSSNTGSGQTFITDLEIPLAPLTSLAQLQNLPQQPIDGLNWSGYYFQNHAIGNSFANPGVESDKVKTNSFPFYLGQYFHWEGGDISGKTHSGEHRFNTTDRGGYSPTSAPALIVDRSYAANHLLWDNYFFSSLTSQNDLLYNKYSEGQSRTVSQVIEEFYSDDEPIPNGTLQAHLGSSGGLNEVKDDLIAAGGGVQSDAYKKVSKYLTVQGGFNINSTSVPAWKAVLGGMLKKKTAIIDSNGTAGGITVEEASENKFVVSRFTVPNGPGEDGKGGDGLWSGYRELDEGEVSELADAIVKQVKERGPFRSLGEFINRRLGSDSDEKSLYGALQAALEDSSVSINDRYRDKITKFDISGTDYAFENAALGSRYQGTPAYIAQADILNSLGPIINARSDTFTIRAYGESLSPNGVTIEAAAWCEAVVQRNPDYVDGSDDPETKFDNLTSVANEEFGRRFQIKSFRWLNNEEV